MNTYQHTRTTYGPTNGFPTEITITLPLAPWDAPNEAKPAPPRALDDVWCQSVVARPVMPPKSPRLAVCSETLGGKTMAEVVAAESLHHRFQRQYSPMQKSKPNLAEATEFEKALAAIMKTEMSIAEVVAITGRNRHSVRSAMDRMVNRGILTRHKPNRSTVLIYSKVKP